MTQLIMCAVRVWRQMRAVVVDGVACDRGDRQRGVGGNDLLSESSSMMAGVYPRSSALVAGVYTRASALVGELDTWASALIGELAPPLRAGCWTSSGLHIITGSLLMMGRGAWTCGGVGAVGGTSPRSSVRSVWIVASPRLRRSDVPLRQGSYPWP